MTGVGTPQVGAVTSFDEPRGLGEVTGSDGTVRTFHCVAIADGSRSVSEGATVSYVVRAGMPGRWEAFEIAPFTGC